MSDIDRFPVKDLESRYGIARSAVYTRMDALKIQRTKVGNRAYLSGSQLQLMDALHQWIQQGGTTAEFLEFQKQVPPSNQPTPAPLFGNTTNTASGGLANLSPDIVQLVSFLATEIVNRMQVRSPQEAQHLAYLQALDQAAQQGWLLSTSDLSSLLGISQARVLKLGNSFSDGGFLFTRRGKRVSGEVAWQVSREQ